MKLKPLSKIFTSEYYVIVFDLCSSSILLEKLQEQNKLNIWRKFWKDIFKYLNKISSGGAKCIVYKFVGDGFILLYKPRYKNNLLSFCDNIKIYINEKVNNIIKNNFTDYVERIGITIGIDKGTVIRMRLYGNVEYMGKAINVAARLQSLLKLPEHSNKILVSQQVQTEISEQLTDRTYKSIEATLHNLHGDKSITCYEIETK